MIPDFPHNLRIRLARLKFLSAKLRQPTGQRQSNVMTQHFFLIGPILFLYYEESQVSSNLNSKLFRFHCVRPSVHTLGFNAQHEIQILNVIY